MAAGILRFTMDSLITAAARALAVGDALGALAHVGRREDPPAVALRGIAMAQLGEYGLARQLLRRAARGFGAREETARARCVVAEAEVALAMRELGAAPRSLMQAASVLETRGDRINAARARLIAVHRLLLLGRLAEVARELPRIELRGMPPALAALAELIAAELALRGLHTMQARAALQRAEAAAVRSRISALVAEVAALRAVLELPAARLLHANGTRLLQLHEVDALFQSGSLVVDACRRGLRAGDRWQSLARRPVLFALACALAEAWPGDVDRDVLIRRVFAMRRPDESHRVRLRVELGRLRALVAPFARIEPTARGFRLAPRDGRAVFVLLPPVESEQASLLALLADGAAWSTSALALALGASQRTVQRALVELEAAGAVRSTGRARKRRWLSSPLTGFTTILLLPAELPPA